MGARKANAAPRCEALKRIGLRTGQGNCWTRECVCSNARGASLAGLILCGETAPELSFLKGVSFSSCHGGKRQLRERAMNGLIYLVGLIVVILFILSLLGLR
jgi:hypothetical protein